MQRVYQIPRDELLWKYTWEDVQEYLHNIPIDRIVNIVAGQKESDIKKRYIESFADPLSNEVVSKQLDTQYEQFEERLKKLKQEV
jgi:hypothetical protein